MYLNKYHEYWQITLIRIVYRRLRSNLWFWNQNWIQIRCKQWKRFIRILKFWEHIEVFKNRKRIFIRKKTIFWFLDIIKWFIRIASKKWNKYFHVINRRNSQQRKKREIIYIKIHNHYWNFDWINYCYYFGISSRFISN